MRLQRIQISVFAYMLLAASGSATDALATDYFVRKTGNDANPGTSAASAWLTVDHAADTVAPGDTIYVGAGTYDELVMPAVTGTLAQPIQLIADTDGAQTGDAGEVVLAAPADSSMALYIANISHVHVYGFKITGGLSRTVYWNNSDGGILDGCEITGSSYQGLYVYQAELDVRSCNIHDNGDAGVYVPGSSAKDTLLDLTDCTIGNNGAAGVSFYTQYVTVSLARCTIQNNATYGIWANGATVTASNCLITGTTGIDGVYGRSSCNIALRNCTIADSKQSGVYAYSSGTIVATNCVIATNGHYGLRNSGATLTHTYNLLHGNAVADFYGTSQDSTEIVADPQFAGSGYEIPNTSPAINAGTDMTGTVDDDITGRPRPYDGAWDIGCYEEGPIVYWKLDESSGTTAADSSGLGNDGIYTGTFTLGQSCAPFGTAVYFSIGIVKVGGNSTIDEIESFTAACWVKSDTASWNDDVYMISKADGKFSLRGIAGSKKIIVGITTSLGSNSESFDLSSLAGFDIRNWHHYAGSYDSVEGVIRLYMDGVLVTSRSIGAAPLAGGTGSLMVNELYGAMLSTVDDVRLYDRRLTDVEIAGLYGMVGHWKLDETSGPTAKDSTAFANDGALQGAPIWRPADGKIKGALEFNGSTDYVDLGTLDVSGGAMSIAAWFKADDFDGGDCRIVSKASGNSTQSHFWMLSTIVINSMHSSTTRLQMRIRANGSTSTLLANSGDLIPGEWTHAVAVYDGTDMVLYKDAVEVGRTGKTGTLATNPAVSVWIGDNPGSKSRPFDGMIDDLRIYGRALCGDEIAELYGGGTLAGWRIKTWVEIDKP